MNKIATLTLVTAMGLGLAACGETRNERALSGGLIGAGAGAVVGSAVSGGRASGALVGGALGAAGGAVVGANTRPERRSREVCYGTNRYGERYRVPCRY
ncbi:glycine zipper domain-containing protein [Methylopila sp. 73B]|uniref:glycine zipper domain-containing protein n=1 Tax=Methylopila sp. 73B TaxID=1120792 RepID=UPI0003626B59|nr:glycine zipper domain-containing protein [Methylopila sp. 73B]